jgi:hypothetical protein
LTGVLERLTGRGLELILGPRVLPLLPRSDKIARPVLETAIIVWPAVAQAGVSGEMVRDLMVAAVERRFGTTRGPSPVKCGANPWPDTALHTGPQPGVEWHVGSLRQNAETRLRSGGHPTQSRDHPRFASDLDRGLLRDSPALRREVPLPSQVHQAQCPNPTAGCPVKWGPLQRLRTSAPAAR